MIKTHPEPNLYDVLGLLSPRSGVRPSQQDVKRAYHRALLHYHPDKQPTTTNNARQPQPHPTTSSVTPSIDLIVRAYKTLSNQALRAEYDHTLRLGGGGGGGHLPSSSSSSHTSLSSASSSTPHSPPPPPPQTGIETVDLDDLAFDGDAKKWFRECRCGDPVGFTVTEEELEECAPEGVVLVGCKGCSLWLRLEFGVVELDDGGDDGG